MTKLTNRHTATILLLLALAMSACAPAQAVSSPTPRPTHTPPLVVIQEPAIEGESIAIGETELSLVQEDGIAFAERIQAAEHGFRVVVGPDRMARAFIGADRIILPYGPEGYEYDGEASVWVKGDQVTIPDVVLPGGVVEENGEVRAGPWAIPDMAAMVQVEGEGGYRTAIFYSQETVNEMGQVPEGENIIELPDGAIVFLGEVFKDFDLEPGQSVQRTAEGDIEVLDENGTVVSRMELSWEGVTSVEEAEELGVLVPLEETVTPQETEEPVSEFAEAVEAIEERIAWSEESPTQHGDLQVPFRLQGDMEDFELAIAEPEQVVSYFEGHPPEETVRQAANSEENMADGALRMVLSVLLPSYREMTEDPEATIDDLASEFASDPEFRVPVRIVDEEGHTHEWDVDLTSGIVYTLMEDGNEAIPPELRPLTLDTRMSMGSGVEKLEDTFFVGPDGKVHVISWNGAWVRDAQQGRDWFLQALIFSQSIAGGLEIPLYFNSMPDTATWEDLRAWNYGHNEEGEGPSLNHLDFMLTATFEGNTGRLPWVGPVDDN